MRILFLSQYFPPETGAAQNRLSDLAVRLTTAGHEVVVLTAVPSYPKSQIFDGYRGRFVLTEVLESIKIIRTWAIVTKNKKFFSRLANYISFAILSLIIGAFKVGGTDVLFVESPPLFLAITGFLLSKVKRAKFVLNISDLWPDSAVALGMLRNPWLIRGAFWLEEGLYRRASLVTGQTRGIIDSIRNRCPDTVSLLLTNGVSPEFLASMDASRTARRRTREEYGFGSRLIVAYTGVHGFAQGLDTIIYAAEILKEHQDIQFVFFGDGPEKSRLQATAAHKGLRNVEFLETESASRMPEILAAIDISVVPLKRHSLFKGALPSKLFEAMGASVPVIVGIDGEARLLVELSGCGLSIEPEDSNELARAILALYRDPALRESLGKRGRAYVCSFHDRQKIADTLEHSLSVLVYGQNVGLAHRPQSNELKPSEVEVVGPNYNK